MNQSTINFEELLSKILDVINVSEEDKKELIKKYAYQASINLASFLYDKVGGTDEFKAKIKEIAEHPDDEKAQHSDMFGLLDYFEKNISPEEKTNFYLTSKLSTFLDFVNPFINNASEEELIKIGDILKGNEAFYEMYKDWKELNKENLVQQTN